MDKCIIDFSKGDELFRLSRAEHGVVSTCLFLAKERKFIVNREMIDNIIEKTGLADSTVKNAFTTLVKKGVLDRDKKYQGIYYFSEKYFKI